MYSPLLILILFVDVLNSIYLYSATSCNDKSIIIDVRPKEEHNGKQEVYANLYSSISIGSNTKTHVDVLVLRPNGWIKIWDLWYNDFCKFINRFGASALADLFRHANIRPNSCPLPKMNSTVTDYVFDWEKIGYKILPKGRFKASVNIYSTVDNVNIGCFTMIFANK